MGVDRLLNTSPTDLAEYLVARYKLDVPKLRQSEWSAIESEVQIDVSSDPSRWITDRGRPFHVPGQRFEIEVPFDGDAELFYARASTFSSNPPRAKIQGQSLFLTFEITHGSAERNIRADAERRLDEIEEHLGWLRRDTDSFNQGLPSEAVKAIAARRDRLLANQGRAAALGIPLKQRADAPKTYVAPDVRRKVRPALPPASSTAYEPEPTLDIETYEHILSVIQSMTHVMERSPSAFQSMGEEDIRQQFLVQLNGQYEGGATGETFNVGGKTDILVRVNDRNIFIAECKFWKGPKHYRETIDQLLGYTAWRDTKTAILIFNRSTALSTVLAGIQAETSAHPNHKRTLDWKHESGFRYVFHHSGDPNREFLLTVLAFDIPSPSALG